MKNGLILLTFFLPVFWTFSPTASHGANSASFQEGTTVRVGNFQDTLPRETLGKWVTNKPAIRTGAGNFSEIANISLCLSRISSCWLELTLAKASRSQIENYPEIDRSAIRNYVSDLSRRADIEPIDAKFRVENERVIEFAPSQEGIRLDQEKSVAVLSELALGKIVSAGNGDLIDLPFERIKPQIANADDNGLGIATLIGEGTSNFAGSPKNRVFNIRVATERFNGVLIKPGEDFSFVSILGPVDGEHGYLPELVIKKDKTEPEFGGGICQVSTTTFRAAIYSGLKITARRNHAYPVRYYDPQGMDATVYVPRPDLRFTNNTPGHILIQTSIEGTVLKFRFYGTDDGRKVEVDGPHIIERRPDGGMKTVFSQKVFDKDGNELISDVFNSNYDSPNKYPHPGQEPPLTKKPDGWSDSEWKKYKKEHGIT